MRCKHELLACNVFATWVSCGKASAGCTREPTRKVFTELALYDSDQDRYQAARQRLARERRAARLAELQRQARQETFKHKRRVAAGLAKPLSEAERRKIVLARRRQRWKIDPALRERYLRSKRVDAIRRGRSRGAAPQGSKGNRRHRIEGQRRRRLAEREREGRTLNGPQFRALREQLGLSVWEIAERFGVTYSAAKQWQRSCGPPVDVERWLCSIMRESDKRPAPPRRSDKRRRRPRLSSARPLTANNVQGPSFALARPSVRTPPVGRPATSRYRVDPSSVIEI